MTDREAKRFEKKRQDSERYQKYIELKKKISEANKKWNDALRDMSTKSYFYDYLNENNAEDAYIQSYQASTDLMAYHFIEYKAGKLTLNGLAANCCGLFYCGQSTLFYKDEQGMQQVRDEATVLKLICDYILARKELLDAYRKGIKEEKRLLEELREL